MQKYMLTRSWALGLLVILVAVGFADTIYLAAKAATGGPVVCNVVEGCGVVLESKWATIGGLPTAFYGLGFYGLLAVFAIAYTIWRDHQMLLLVALVSTIGVIVSAFFVYLQLFVIGAICAYCMLSAVITTAIFGLVWTLVYRDWFYHKTSS
jgi:uncharacterized membrane protein